MKKLFYIFLSLAIFGSLSIFSFAAEHPSEHPSIPEASEHREHPGTHTEEHPGEPAMLSANDIIKGIKSHINTVTEENDGYYPLSDEQEGQDLMLQLVKVHENKVSYIKKDNAYFACTDFISDDGKATYDVDFWMTKDASGVWQVYKTAIHKKDGRERFTYKDDEIMPVK